MARTFVRAVVDDARVAHGVEGGGEGDPGGRSRDLEDDVGISGQDGLDERGLASAPVTGMLFWLMTTLAPRLVHTSPSVWLTVTAGALS